MECTEPGAIRDEELFAYLAGEKVRPAVVQHLANCQHCLAQLATYRQMELKLTNKLYRWDFSSNQLLGEYQLGLLNKQLTAEIKSPLKMCVLCSAEIATLTEFLANDPRLVERASEPQISVVAQTSLNNHRAAREVKRSVEQLLEQSRTGTRRIIAALVPQQPRLAFQRDSAQQASVWPRRYTAEDMNISIQVERGPHRKDALQLIGFVMRQGSTLEALQGTPVQLTSQTNKVYTQNIDELGNFVFSSIVPATYTLELCLADGVVVIDQFPVT